jgi:hypothetical protein
LTPDLTTLTASSLRSSLRRKIAESPMNSLSAGQESLTAHSGKQGALSAAVSRPQLNSFSGVPGSVETKFLRETSNKARKFCSHNA